MKRLRYFLIKRGSTKISALIYQEGKDWYLRSPPRGTMGFLAIGSQKSLVSALQKLGYTGDKYYTTSKPPEQNPTNLYRDFHGAEPKQRMVNVEPPTSPLIKIGRITRLEYKPEWPSSRRDTTYFHDMGQTLTKKLKSNAILATDKSGKNLYIIKDKNGKHPYFSSRGIIGAFIPFLLLILPVFHLLGEIHVM